jgi:hypothetical protein
MRLFCRLEKNKIMTLTEAIEKANENQNLICTEIVDNAKIDAVMPAPKIYLDKKKFDDFIDSFIDASRNLEFEYIDFYKINADINGNDFAVYALSFSDGGSILSYWELS